MAVNLNPKPISINNLDELRQNANLSGAQVDAQGMLNELNTAGIMDAHGNRMQFNTLEEWQDFLKDSGPKFQGTTQLDANMLATMTGNISACQNNLRVASNNNEIVEMLEAMKKLLESGDILAAVSLLNQSQVKVLDQQLSGRIMAMQERNANIKSLNDKLAEEQGKAGSPPTGPQQESMTKLKGQIDKLNGDSQLDMIQIQSLTTKRNQAFEMLSNLTSKLQSAMSTIIGNMRG